MAHVNPIFIVFVNNCFTNIANLGLNTNLFISFLRQ
nr:MAG TPA: hypothetical protein [Caudoviricetes sp.]